MPSGEIRAGDRPELSAPDGVPPDRCDSALNWVLERMTTGRVDTPAAVQARAEAPAAQLWLPIVRSRSAERPRTNIDVDFTRGLEIEEKSHVHH